MPVEGINRSKVRCEGFSGIHSLGSENGDAPNQVMERELPFLEDICKLVPLPTSPEAEGKPDIV